MSVQALKPFFTYYGGKYRVAPHYPVPRYTTIIEPFCGSAGYSLRYPQRTVRLYDLNERIVRVWNYLIGVTPEEILGLPEVFDDVRTLDLSQEAKWLIGFWLNKGSAEPRNKPAAWMRSGVRPNSYWGLAVKQRIAAQLPGIRHWTCELADYRSVPNAEATWFIDPPYMGPAGRLYTENEINYSELADWCRGRSGQVLVCESAGADWLPFRQFRTAKANPSVRGKQFVNEVLWAQGE